MSPNCLSLLRNSSNSLCFAQLCRRSCATPCEPLLSSVCNNIRDSTLSLQKSERSSNYFASKMFCTYFLQAIQILTTARANVGSDPGDYYLPLHIQESAVLMLMISGTIYDQARISPRGQQLLSAPYSKDSNIRIAKAWTKGLSRAIVDPTADIKDCLGRLSQLSHDDNDQTQWIVGSDEFTSWLQVQQSQILRIGLQTPPHSLDNALSYTSALLASTMQSTNRVVVLALFCMHRNNESSAVRDSGPVALLTSLNSQLLRVIAEQTTAVDLSTVEGLDNRELASKARTRIKYGIALFSTLLSLLPEGTAVFMIVDSLSRISGSTKDSDRFMEKLMETIHDRDNVLVKTLITDDMPGSYTQRTADISLYVPDTAQGACAVGIAENEWSMDVVKKVSRSWTLDTAADKPRSRKSKDGGRRRKERDDSPADSSTSDTAIEESRSHKGRDTGRRRKERDEVSDESSSSDDC